MRRGHYLGGLLFIIAALGLALSSSPAATAPTPIVDLPACGLDPNANTLALQQAINNAPGGSTLVLPSGVCVLAKCTIANQSAACYTKPFGRHYGALDIGGKTSGLTLAGAADGTSVLKLDPNPPRRSDGYHGYCEQTHVLSIRKSSHITLRNFIIDGSDGELPEDTTQCPNNGGRIADHMNDVQLENSTDITIDGMQLNKAHGDGLNLIANHPSPTPTPPYIPFTERVSVTGTYFMDNDGAGIAFQRNVGYVTLRYNYFTNSGDQDVAMQSTGGPNDLGPYEVHIDSNLFERVKPGVSVTLGAGSTPPSNQVNFTTNTILGGCISVYKGINTAIVGNTVTGAQQCVPVSALRVFGLQLINNRLAGYANVTNKATGFFVPQPVIAISKDVVNQGDTDTCGAPPKPQPCPYFIYYPDLTTVWGNIITQHVQNSPGITLSDVDELVLESNMIAHTHTIAPAGPFNPNNPVPRPTSIDLSFGVPLAGNGYFLNERTLVNRWSITKNDLRQFADGIKIRRLKAAVSVSQADVNANRFGTTQSSPQGIWLVGAPGAAQSGFINYLTVDRNLFGCGFPRADVLPPFAFVRPSGQAHGGNIGSTTVCLQ